MREILIAGKPFSLEERVPLRVGAPVTVQGVELVFPPPLYALQLDQLDLQARHAAGEVEHKALATSELTILVSTLRRNYPNLPDEFVAEWDTADIWRLREALIKASTPPEDPASGEAPSR